MALGFNKNRDTIEVFNDRWDANHNTKQVNDFKNKQNSFNNKLFGTNSVFDNRKKVETMEDKVSNLNKQISHNNEINRASKINSVIDKFRK